MQKLALMKQPGRSLTRACLVLYWVYVGSPSSTASIDEHQPVWFSQSFQAIFLGPSTKTAVKLLRKRITIRHFDCSLTPDLESGDDEGRLLDRDALVISEAPYRSHQVQVAHKKTAPKCRSAVFCSSMLPLSCLWSDWTRWTVSSWLEDRHSYSTVLSQLSPDQANSQKCPGRQALGKVS